MIINHEVVLKEITRSAILPYPIDQVYALVNDIEAYPDYMSGCVGAEIHQQSETMMDGSLHIAKAGLSYTLRTSNILNPPLQIKMQLVDGPFKEFRGEWNFIKLSEEACKVTFQIAYTFKNRLLERAVKGLVDSMADNMVQATIKRAEQNLS